MTLHNIRNEWYTNGLKLGYFALVNIHWSGFHLHNFSWCEFNPSYFVDREPLLMCLPHDTCGIHQHQDKSDRDLSQKEYLT